MTTNVTWPAEIGKAVTPATNYTTLFNTSLTNKTISLSKSFESLGGDNTTTGNLTKWCLQSSDFGDFFDAKESATKKNFTMTVNVIMSDLQDGTCVEKNFDQAVFCDLENNCADYPPTLTLLDKADDDSDTNWLLWGGIGAAGLVVVVVVAVLAMKGGKGSTDKGVSMQD